MNFGWYPFSWDGTMFYFGVFLFFCNAVLGTVFGGLEFIGYEISSVWLFFVGLTSLLLMGIPMAWRLVVPTPVINLD